MYHLDEPTSDPAAISLYFVAKLASRDLKVVLSGEGADEFSEDTIIIEKKLIINFIIKFLMVLDM